MSINYSKLRKYDPFDYTHQTFSEFYAAYCTEARRIGIKVQDSEYMRDAMKNYRFKEEQEIKNEFGEVCP